MKKILIAVACFVSLVTIAQSATPNFRFLPLLSGYNVQVSTNQTLTIGSTNVLFTDYKGSSLLSLTTNSYNGVVNTNTYAGDAFAMVHLSPDVNGDITANAELYVLMDNTNLLPQYTTNNFGQNIVTNWPLAVSTIPNWGIPLATNAFGTYGVGTNAIQVTLYRVVSSNPQGGIGPDLQPKFTLAETTGSLVFNVTNYGPNSVGTGLMTNIPALWLQGARDVYMSVTETNVAGSANVYSVINQAGILQPQP